MRDQTVRFLIILTLLVTAALCCMPLQWLMPSFAIDDGFYYPRVAQNIVEGHGVTYDRRTITNGFHPLWEAILLLPALVARGDHFWMLRGTFIAAGILVAIGLFAFAGLGRRLHWTVTGLLVGLAMAYFPRIDLWMGLMEAGATMSVLFLMLYLCLRFNLLQSQSIRGDLLFGLLMAMTFLVRLDQVFIVMAMVAGSLCMRICARESWRRWVLHLLTGGLFALLLVTPYLAANWYHFGSIVPVSGQKKHVMAESAAAIVRSAWQPIVVVSRKTGLPEYALGAALAMASCVALYAVRVARRQPEGESPRLAIGGVVPFFALGVAARWLYLRVFVAHESARVPWYWVPEYVLFFILAAYLVSCFIFLLPTRLRTPLRATVARWVCVVVLLGLGTAYVVMDAQRSREENTLTMEAADWAREHLPPSSVYAMYDSGCFSYVSQRDTVSLNGLISDKQTMEESRAKRYNAIMDRLGVDYLVVYLLDKEIAAAPREAFLYQSPKKIERLSSPHGNRRLCILDWRKYSPYPA